MFLNFEIVVTEKCSLH